MPTPFHLSDTDIHRVGDGELLQYENFATKTEVAAWSASITASDASFTNASTGSNRQSSTARSDRTAWEADHPGVFGGMRERFVEVRTELNEAAWMGLDVFSIQLAVYDAGASYAAHRDALRNDPTRRITAILYLNPDWKPADGGCLRIHGSAGHRDVEPRGGRLVVFRSDRLLHEVLPGRSVRRAATAWFRGRSSPR